MPFSNLFFIFMFLPLSLILYYVSPVKIKNVTLTVVSLIFYSWGTPKYIFFMLFSILFNYFAGLELGKLKENFGSEKRIKMTMIFAVLANILLLCFFKYWGFVVDNLNLIPFVKLSNPGLAAPIGISFFTFQVLSYIFDVYRDKAPAQKNVIDFALYVSFFPKLIQGPICEYNKFFTQLKDRSVNIYQFGEGARLFILGLAKKMILADNFSQSYTQVSALTSMSTGSAWLGCIFYTLDIYFDWTSYTDMATGIAKMFGFDVGKNFDYPYSSLTVAEFWRRWHISLGAWFRNYVYIPLGGNRVSKPKYIRNIMTVWFLTGFWHGSGWNFIVWGLFYGCILLLENFVLKDILPKIPNVAKRIYTMLMVMIGWVFFYSPNLGAAIRWLGKMFFIGSAGIWDTSATYFFSGNLLLLIIGIIGCTQFIPKLSKRLTEFGTLGTAAINVTYIILLIGSIAYMVNSTYSSFLYFQF
ncbi:MAG: MBOAT family O-acyltransferase [Clostridia bacterium]|nr:MBOAT family O-acyltransferase [Clostridia bacterium]